MHLKDQLATDDKKTNDAIASLYEGRAKVPVGIVLTYDEKLIIDPARPPHCYTGTKEV